MSEYVNVRTRAYVELTNNDELCEALITFENIEKVHIERQYMKEEHDVSVPFIEYILFSFDMGYDTIQLSYPVSEQYKRKWAVLVDSYGDSEEFEIPMDSTLSKCLKYIVCEIECRLD
jgi:hypothetical protein